MYFIDQWIIIWILLWKCCRNIKYEILKPQQQQQQQDFVCAFIYFWIYIYKLYEGNSEMNVLINWCPLNRMECGKEREQLGMEWDDSWPWTCTCSHIIMCDLWVGSRSMGASHHNGGWRWPGGGREVPGRWMNKRRFVSASASRWRRADACREMRPGSMRTDTHTAGAFRRSSGLWKSNKKMKKMKEMKKQKKISLDLYFAKCGLVWVAAQPTCLPLDIWIGFPFISFFFLMMGIDWSTNLFCVWGRIEPAVDWTRLFFFNYLMVRWRPVSDGVPSAMAAPPLPLEFSGKVSVSTLEFRYMIQCHWFSFFEYRSLGWSSTIYSHFINWFGVEMRSIPAGQTQGGHVKFRTFNI